MLTEAVAGHSGGKLRRPVTRVLYVHHRGEGGGAPESLAQLIRALDRDRFEPHVYCPPGPAASLFRAAGASVHTGPVAGFTHIWAATYRGVRWLLLLRELARLPGHLVALRRTLERERPDLVHLNDSPLVAAAWLAGRRGVPVVWHLRSAPGGAGRDLRARALRHAIRSLSAAALAINDDVASLWRVPAAIIPNPVDLERFSPGDQAVARGRLGLPADGKVVGFVGFLYPAKGYRELLRAAAILRDRGVEATLVVAGGGVRTQRFFRSSSGRILQRLGLVHDDESEAHALAAELGLGLSVRFMPYTDDVEVVYRASDVVVAPSQGPEIGRSLLEAAAVGVAAVGTGSTTGGEVLAPGVTTLLARDTGAEAIADAVAELLADDDAREAIGAAARLHAVATFDPQRIAELVAGAYAAALPTITP
jgi:glycosyltransferase involved in cell wall biosynthesis